MSYNYQSEKPGIFTDEGQRKFLQIRDHVQSLLKVAGCFQMGEAIRKTLGSNWEAMACVDRLVELGEIREVSQEQCAGQCRVFVSAR
jgi:hypothetical protein